MAEDLETKTKPSWKFRWEDFTAFIGMGIYTERNQYLNEKSREYAKFTFRKLGLVFFNVTLSMYGVLPLANYLSDLAHK